MAGYNQHSMSNNAVDAYARGAMPLSKLTARDLKVAGIGITLGFARWLAKEEHWKASEWHHSSSWYNEVEFYDLDTLAELLEEEKASVDGWRETFLAQKKAKVQKDEEVVVTGEYAVWGGTRKHPRIEEWVPFEGILKGNWIFFKGGRKQASGNYINWQVKSENGVSA